MGLYEYFSTLTTGITNGYNFYGVDRAGIPVDDKDYSWNSPTPMLNGTIDDIVIQGRQRSDSDYLPWYKALYYDWVEPLIPSGPEGTPTVTTKSGAPNIGTMAAFAALGVGLYFIVKGK